MLIFSYLTIICPLSEGAVTIATHCNTLRPYPLHSSKCYYIKYSTTIFIAFKIVVQNIYLASNIYHYVSRLKKLLRRQYQVQCVFKTFVAVYTDWQAGRESNSHHSSIIFTHRYDYERTKTILHFNFFGSHLLILSTLHKPP